VQGNVSAKNAATYTFDYGNRLRTTAGLTYRYDADGRRVRQDSAGGSLKYSYFTKDGRLVWQRDEPAGKRISNIYFAGSVVAEYSRPIGATTVTISYLHTDALGSPIAKTNASKVNIQPTKYEPYGLMLRPNDDRVGFTGHLMDSASGLTYMQQRYYDPGVSRFLSVDPVTADANLGTNFNRYWYANNNPYRFTDPDGRYSCDGTKSQCGQVAAYRAKLGEAREGLQKGTDAYAKVDRAIGYLGEHNDDNGVTVRVTTLDPGTAGESSSGSDVISVDLKQIADSGGQYADVVGAGTLAHEARHELDAKDHGSVTSKSSVMRTELNAYRTNAAVGEGLRMDVGLGTDKKIHEAAEASTAAWCAESGGAGC
jgi:RHS repeat-associated protein